MSEMNERVFNCCPPPHQCPSHHCSSHDRVTMGEWMHYINTYIDVRARQIYDKLKALIPTSSGVVNKIIAGDNITVTPESGQGTVTINAKDEDKIKDFILIRDKTTNKIYKVFMSDNVICTEESDS